MRKKVVEKYSLSEEKDKKKLKRKRKKEKKRAPRPETVSEKPTSSPKPEMYLFPEMEKRGDFQFPPLNLLDTGTVSEQIDKNEL